MLVSQDPYSLDLESLNEDKPMIDFFNIKNYKITQEGINMRSTANRAQRFDDRDVLYGIDVLMIKKDGADRLKSDNGTLKDNVLYLNGNVRYARNGFFNVSAESVEYHENSKMLIGKTPFTFEGKNIKAFGDSFVYNTKNGRIEAEKFSTSIQMREK
jgi:LPS export ABC transporter protein LptC